MQKRHLGEMGGMLVLGESGEAHKTGPTVRERLPLICRRGIYSLVMVDLGLEWQWLYWLADFHVNKESKEQKL